MRAATFERPGLSSEVLSVTEVSIPEPGSGEVRVRLAFAGLNPTDWKRMRTGAPAGPFQVPGQDGAGTIDAVGEGVDPARVGQRVWLYMAAANNQWGTLAQFCVVPSGRAVPLANSASFELGASLGVPALTAAHCLRADGPIEGLTVLIAGGAGAVGRMGIEFAKLDGAAQVITTVSSQSKAELALQAGADVVVNYREEDAAGQIRAAAPNGVDRVLEVDLAANAGLDLDVVAPGAVIVTYAGTNESVATLPVRRLMMLNAVLRFMLLYEVTPQQLASAIGATQRAIDAGALTTAPLHVYPLAQAVEALQAVENGAVGKVLVDTAAA